MAITDVEDLPPEEIMEYAGRADGVLDFAGDGRAKVAAAVDRAKNAVSRAVDRIKAELEGWQLGKGWFGREAPLLSLSPTNAFVVGWTALLGTQAAFSLPQTRPHVEKLLGSEGAAAQALKTLSIVTLGAIARYYRKEGQFLGPVVLDREIPAWITVPLKVFGILAVSHGLFRHATLEETTSGKVGSDAEVGFKRLSKRPILLGASVYGLGQFLEDRTKGSLLFWGVGAVAADVVAALADVREGKPFGDSLPFKAIAQDPNVLVQAVKELNPIAAAVGILGSLRWTFPDAYHKMVDFIMRR
ncbi:hypothetical protein DFJ74DRAFT_708980 [Hyaloraphidium curvatum]|nr:hypothetical protein DFJ74DRAFT_708980 [Hyaloraphidium curvatum]